MNNSVLLDIPLEKRAVSYAQQQIKLSSYVAPPFQVEYVLTIP